MIWNVGIHLWKNNWKRTYSDLWSYCCSSYWWRWSIFRPGKITKYFPTVFWLGRFFFWYWIKNATRDPGEFNSKLNELAEAGHFEKLRISSTGETERPPVGMHIVAQFNEDQMWYRAEVIKVCWSTSVYFIHWLFSRIQEVSKSPLSIMETLKISPLVNYKTVFARSHQKFARNLPSHIESGTIPFTIIPMLRPLWTMFTVLYPTIMAKSVT